MSERLVWKKDFRRELKTGLGIEGPLVYLNNFEVEAHWADLEAVFPLAPSLGSSNQVVNRMEELGILLASPGDTVVLKEQPDPEFLRYLEAQGFALPELLIVERNQPELNITQNILGCPTTLQRLRALACTGAHLIPFGSSFWEQRLSVESGIPLATPPAEISRLVNSKIYSRRLNAELGIREVPGASCTSLGDLRAALDTLSPLHLVEGGKLVVKEAMGVSGKGQVVVGSAVEGDRFFRLLERMASKRGTDKVNLVVEKWIDKLTEFNYQFLVGKDGTVDYHYVKESLVRNGVHQGHSLPGTLTGAQEEILCTTTALLGRRLAEDGYFGIVGVDGMIARDGTLYPNLEINARFNMSTYLARVQASAIDENQAALVKKYSLKLTEPVPFTQVQRALGSLIYSRSTGRGFLVTGFATLNAAYTGVGSFEGRLYGAVIGPRETDLNALDAEIERRLRELQTPYGALEKCASSK